ITHIEAEYAGGGRYRLLVLDGRLCRCGRGGCAEAYVGAPGILQPLGEIAPNHRLLDATLQRDAIGAMARAASGEDADPAVRETIARTAYYLGAALADLVAVVNPAVVTLTGWTTWTLGSHLLPAVREHLREQAPGPSILD